MGEPVPRDIHEGENSVLDSLTRVQLDQAAEEYDENKQVLNYQAEPSESRSNMP